MADTLVELIRSNAQSLGDRTAYRFWRDGAVTDVTWSKFDRDCDAFAQLLIDRGAMPGDRIVLLSENRYEWLAADQAILRAGAITVALHYPLTKEQAAAQAKDCGARLAIVSGEHQSAKLPDLDCILIDSIGCQPSDEVMRRSKAIDPNDVATIIYTSGTTGESKGAMLTHQNLLSNARALRELVQAESHENVVLNFLPLSHIYARTSDYLSAAVQGVIMALAASIETVGQDLQTFRPHAINAVPRFYEKVRERIIERRIVRLLGPLGRRLAVKKAFGGRLRYAFSGGAALDPTVQQFFSQAGLTVYQGYGLTETSPVVSTCWEKAFKPNTAGRAAPSVEIKIAEDGEILVRGPNVFVGYWNNEAATKEAFDEDGWFRTGDVGEFDNDGFLKITDRKKDIFVLSGGKNVAPMPIENALANDPFILQAVVFGDKQKFTGALIVPDREALSAKFDLSDNEGIKTFLQQRIDLELATFSPHERVKRFAIVEEPFSMENGSMTVTLKLRRSRILQQYADLVEKVYRD